MDVANVLEVFTDVTTPTINCNRCPMQLDLMPTIMTRRPNQQI